MNEIQHNRMEEDAAFGEFLLRAIADPLGIAPTEKDIEKAVYKGTNCGAWVKFDELGCIIGTIVEGSDAEYSERIPLDGIDTDEAGEAEFNRRFWEALTRAEDFANEHWEG